MDVPVRRVLTSPTQRAELVAAGIHRYTAAPQEREYRLMPWNMGPLTGKGNLTSAEKATVRAHMGSKMAVPMPGGESYMFFLSRLLPFVATECCDSETVAVTHRSDIVAIMAWDAAGREGLAQDPDVLNDFDANDRIQILELTPECCVPLVVESMGTVPKVI